MSRNAGSGILAWLCRGFEKAVALLGQMICAKQLHIPLIVRLLPLRRELREPEVGRERDAEAPEEAEEVAVVELRRQHACAVGVERGEPERDLGARAARDVRERRAAQRRRVERRRERDLGRKG